MCHEQIQVLLPATTTISLLIRTIECLPIDWPRTWGSRNALSAVPAWYRGRTRLETFDPVSRQELPCRVVVESEERFDGAREELWWRW